MFEASAMRIMIFQLSTIDNCLSKKQSKQTAFKAYCCSVEELDSDLLELELDSDSAGCSSL